MSRFPKSQSSLVLGALLALAATAANAAPATHTSEVTVKGQRSLELQTLVGAVRVERASGPDFVIVTTATANAEPAARATALANAVVAKVEPGNRRVVINWPEGEDAFYSALAPDTGWMMRAKVDYDGRRVVVTRKRADGADVQASIVVRVPDGASLKVVQRFGPIDANAVQADLDLDTVDGGITVERSRGKLRADTGAAAVTVRYHEGDVVADTGSGLVTFEGVRGRQVADTGSGDVNVTKGYGKLDADTGSGDINVDGFTGEIVADTGSGDLAARGVSGLTRLAADTGSGDVKVAGDLSALESLVVDTGSGEVELESSAAPSLKVRVDTGSGDVDATGIEAVRDRDDNWTLTMGAGAHSGVIDTGSGDVTVRVGTVTATANR